MGRDKRRRSSSSESAKSSRFRRRAGKSSSSEHGRDASHRDVHRPRSRQVVSSRGEKSILRRDESRPYVQSPSRAKEGSDSEVSTRLTRLECLMETFIRRSTRNQEERPVRYNIRSDCIPEFQPGNPNLSATKWLDKIDQLAAINDWDEKSKIYHMQNRLSGLAKEWYNNLNNYDKSWNEWKGLIKKSFPENHDFATSLRKLVNRYKEQSESMTEYYFAKMSLLQACEVTGKNAVSCLIDGLQDPTIQTGARAGRYNNPEELYSEFLAKVTSVDKYPKPFKGSEKKWFKKVEVQDTDHKNKHKSIQNRETVRSIKCFNCNEKGHIATKCGKPKVECRNCNRLGHATNNCSRPANVTVKCVKDTKQKNECYFVDCEVNGQKLPGYIDTGCSVVLIKEKDALELNLDIKPCSLMITGYGGGISKVIGSVTIKLKVDLAETEVEALVIPNVIQSVSVLIGQPFLNSEDINVVIRGDKIRVFGSETLELPQIDELPPAKVALWAKDADVIPSNSVGFIKVEGAAEGSVFIELQHRPIPNSEYWVARCITESKEGTVLIANISETPITFKKNQIVVRAIPCEETAADESVSTLKINTQNLEPFSLDDIKSQINEDIDISIKRKLLELLNKYRSCFAKSLQELGKTNLAEMKITLKDTSPVVYKAYRMAYSEREAVRNIVDELLENNIIRESNSPFSSPILLVKKKTGEFRMCVDFRKLNANTIKDRYPIPRIDDQLERLRGCKYFSSLDLANGYYQIPINEESVEKTAFITPDGHYEYLRMPFGLANAPAVFQRTINAALGPSRFTTTLVYMDDILIPTEDIEKGFSVLNDVLKKLRNANLTLRLEKCSFFKSKIDYLGYDISFEGIQPGNRKISAVALYPTPTNIHQVRQFMGLASYFRKFISNFAAIAKPITSLLKKDIKFIWEQKQEDAFETLKSKLSERPILALYDPNARTELHTDASKTGIAGVLLQEQPGNHLKPISYFSRMTTKEEQKYHSYELETLAVICSLKHFRTYLLGVEFKIVTDCSAIRFAMTKRDLVPRIGRWWLTVQEYNYTVEYRAGAKMAHVDALSRNPISDEHILAVDITTDDWVLVAQQRDDYCKYLIEVLSEKPNTEQEKKIHKEYTIKNNRLYKNTDTGKRWVVPKASRKEVVMCHHDNVGHFSVEKTIEYISAKYWFSNMRKYVKNYIDRCLQCIYNKVPAGKSPGFLNVIDKMNIPMHTLHVDHLGPFVKSSQGNTHLLVAVDGFTKFVFMKAVPSTKVGPVIKMFNEIIDMFGVPNRIVCDRGSCFTSEKFTEFCKGLGIKRILNATATPRANGQAERYNRTILNSLATSNEDERKWDNVVSSIRWGINNTFNKSTGKSPYEIFLGYRPRSANDAYLTNEICEHVGGQKDLQELRAQASSSIKRQQKLQKEYYDKKRCKGYTYKVGQHVVVKRTKGSNDGASRKLLPRYNGPYVITKDLGHDRYVIEDLPGATRSRKKYTGITSGDKLKLYKVGDDSGEATD